MSAKLIETNDNRATPVNHASHGPATAPHLIVAILASIGFATLPSFAQVAPTALPQNGRVSAGSAVIGQVGTAMRIDQTSNKAVIDWQSFNVGRDASVQFNQPSASSITLNRVGTDGGRSIIDGRITANGQVWLLNPGGAIFGPSARVDVGGLLASTLKIGNDDFLSGNYRFGKDGSGSVVNQGSLAARDGGYIALLAPEVRNEGVVTARLGTVALASGDEVRVDFAGDRLIEIKVDQAAVNGLIENKNLVEADGGWVVMSAGAANNLTSGAINNEGIIKADSLSTQGGKILLEAGTMRLGGTISSNGLEGGMIRAFTAKDLEVMGLVSANGLESKGGRIDLSGERVHLNGATVAAQGRAQGGLVRVGGGFQGGKTQEIGSDQWTRYIGRFGDDLPMPNAKKVLVNATSVIDVSAKVGMGGTVVVWSDEWSAYAGRLDGLGGSAEISSAKNLGYVNLGGINLGTGFLLLDPLDITIDGTAIVADVIFEQSNTISVGIGASLLAGNLGAGTSVSLQASRDILVQQPINVTGPSAGSTTLYLAAGRTVDIGASINTNGGTLVLEANNPYANVTDRGNGGGAGNISINSSINTGSGSLHLMVYPTNTAPWTPGSISVSNGTTLTSSSIFINAPASAISLGGLTTTDTTIPWSLVVEGASIAQTAPISIAGNSIFHAASGVINLDNPANDFTGRVTLFNANSGTSDISIRDGNDLILGRVEAAGKFTAQAAGKLTLASGSSIKSNGSGDAITLAASSFDNRSQLDEPDSRILGLTSLSALMPIEMSAITPNELKAFSTTQISSIFFSQMPAIRPVDIQVLTTAQISALSSNQTGSLSTSQIRGLTTQQIPALSTSVIQSLSSSNLMSLTSGQIDALTTAQLASIWPGEFSTLTTAQVASISPSKIPAITTGQINSMTTTQARALSGSQLNALSMTQINYLTTDNLTALSTAQLPGLSTTGVSAMTTTQLGVLSTDQIRSLQPIQVDAMAVTQLVNLSTSQLGAFTADQKLTVDSAEYSALVAQYGSGVSTFFGPQTGYSAPAPYQSPASFVPPTAYVPPPPLQTPFSSSGRWLVWSGNPAADTRGSLIFDFKQYSATYGSTTVAGSGNGFLYSIVPLITPSLTGTVVKTYDATTTATLSAANYASTGAIDGDSVAITNPTSGTFDTKNFGTSKTVTASGVAISSATNGIVTVYGYQLSTTSPSAVIGTINKAALTLGGFSAANKIYDATPAATISSVGTLSGVLGTDLVTVSHTGATFSDKNVGNGKAVTLNGIVPSGTDGGNYTLPGTATTSANITAKALSVSGLSATPKVYDATTAATLSGTKALAVGASASGDGLVYTGDTVALSGTESGAFDTKNVGSGKTVTITGLSLTGTDAGNYSLSPITTPANITAKALSVSGLSATPKVYDATTAATLSGTETLTNGASTSGDGKFYTGDTVTLSGTESGAFDTKNVGSGKTVTITGLSLTGIDAGNYSLSPITASADITAKALSVSGLSATPKVYDATTAATLSGTETLTNGASTSGDGKFYTGDTVALSGTESGVFDTKNVGSGKTVTITGLSLTGTDAGNYNLSPINASADITAKALSVSGLSAATKVYDATTAATLSGTETLTNGASTSGDGKFYSGDTVALSGTASATFANKNVGTAIPVSVTGHSITGTDAGNYLLTPISGLAADITSRPLSVTFGSVSKVYDGGTATPLGTPSFGNAIAADLPSLGLSGSGTYDSRHVGTGKAIGYSGLVLSGTAAGNYSLPVTTANGVGAITPLATVAWTGGTTGNWSDLANWAGGALPDGANVTAVSIPSGVSVTFDGTNTASGFLGSANLANLTSLGTLNLSGGTLNVANAFSSYAYNQTGGTYSGTGSFSISNSFLKSGGSFKPTGQVFITQANGNLVVINEAPLVIGSLDVQAGDLEWDNTGGILSNGQIKASGKVSLIARSPISIGAGGIQAGSGVSLSAPTASTGSTISINGAVYSSIGTVAVSGYGDVTLYANVSGGNINIVSSSGSISISPTAVSTVSSGGSISVSAVNGSVTYSGANFSGASPNITSSTFSTAPPAAPAAAPVEQAARQILESDSPEEAPADEVSTVNTMGVIGTGGATLSNFPVAGSSSTVVVSVPAATGGEAGSSAEPVISIVLEVAPRPGPPKLIVNASKSIPRRAGVLNSSELQMLSRQVQEARTQLFSGALSALDKNPEAAEIPDCGSGGGGPCIASRKSLVVAQETYVPVVKRKIALMIGNNAYRSPIPDLETAINDVSAIGEQLRDNLGYEMKVVQNASREAIIEALNDLIRTTERDDSVIVMYAGHGYLKEETKAGYWIPTDAAATSPDKWISNDTIARALGNIPAKQVMLISDSCYSGTLTKEGKVTETVGVSREQTLTQRSVLALSSGGDEPVSDEGYDNHSIFAWNLIRSLKGMSGETTGTQLHSVIKTEVTKEFPQEPQYGTVVSAGHSVGGEYLFTPKRSGN